MAWERAVRNGDDKDSDKAAVTTEKRALRFWCGPTGSGIIMNNTQFEHSRQSKSGKSAQELVAAARAYLKTPMLQHAPKWAGELLSDAVIAFVKSNPSHELVSEFSGGGPFIRWSEVDRWLKPGGDVLELLTEPANRRPDRKSNASNPNLN